MPSGSLSVSIVARVFVHQVPFTNRATLSRIAPQSRPNKRTAVPPKSKEFHVASREILSPILSGLGFSRPRTVGFGGWVRDQGPNWLVLWLQLSTTNYGDRPEGYSFTVALQLGEEPYAGGGQSVGNRLYELLTEDERAELVSIHNAVMEKVSANPSVLMLPFMMPSYRARYLAEQEPRETPFGPNDDPWFRYTDAHDVRRWLDFIGRVLPGAIERFTASGAG
jgi:hypothetical protein